MVHKVSRPLGKNANLTGFLSEAWTYRNPMLIRRLAASVVALDDAFPGKMLLRDVYRDVVEEGCPALARHGAVDGRRRRFRAGGERNFDLLKLRFRRCRERLVSAVILHAKPPFARVAIHFDPPAHYVFRLRLEAEKFLLR